MKKKSNLSKLIQFAGTHKYLTYLSWILSVISAMLSLFPFWYIWQIMRAVLETNPTFSSPEVMIGYGWAAVGFAAAAVILYILALLCAHLAAFRVATNIRLKLSEHMMTLPLGSLEAFGSGRLRRIITETSGSVETYLAHQLPDQAKAYGTIIALLVLLFAIDWRFGLLSLLPIVLGFLSMASMAGKSMQAKMAEFQTALGDMSNEAVEYIRGIPVVKTFGQTVFSFKRFKGSIDRYSEWATAYTKEVRRPMVLYTLGINSIFAFLIIGGLLLSENPVNIDFLLNVVFYIIITPAITVVLGKIMHQSENQMIVTDALKRIDSVLQISPLTVSETEHPENASVELRDVTFSYDGEKNALNHISLSIPAGKTVAFVGPSGGGKSTLANMLVRFFDPQQGEVLIGGANAKAISKKELMENISFVFQNSKLIKGTILDNVRLGKPAATEQEVLEALELARCQDIIEKFPDGIYTMIGTKGVYLSGGEQQRISIARAILKNAPILIMDEATAFSDPDNENKIQLAMKELAKNHTVILIAHRLSTVKNADCIYVLKDGEICESGNFDELNSKNGIFHEMWKDYQKSVEWRVTTV
ncbi:MAG: ABC transporter ATP-binding protein [[Eubacterium] rectale]|nr:ABC transporter ATP-binding protein [Agathobacter rectalis]